MYSAAANWYGLYHQYLQQHAQMSQWLMQVHQNAGAWAPHHCVHNHCVHNHCVHNYCAPNHCVQNYCARCSRPIHKCHAYQPIPTHHYPAVNSRRAGHRQEPLAPVKHMYREEAAEDSSEESEDSSEESEDSSEESEDSSDKEGSEDSNSDDELVFNADAFLALHSAKDASDQDSEDSSESSDSVPDDNKGYFVQDVYGNMVYMPGKVPRPTPYKDRQKELQQRREWYGKGAETIITLEALMGAQFDLLHDTLQPTLWPFQPLL